MKNLSLLFLLLLTLGWADGIGQTLKVGDPAPSIAVRKWIKGKPVEKFKPGMVYVVEFWATWCGPCQSAMPHLSELARKYKGKAEVISIDVKEDKKKTDFLPKVERFVKYSGDRMDYAVAIDASGDVMNKTWLDAAGSNGIPHLFIVDQRGKIAWHGHPNHVDDVLAAVVNDEYDEAGKKRLEAALQEKEKQYDSLGKKMMMARGNKDYKTALATVEKAFPLFPGMYNYFASMKYEFLSHLDSATARQFGEEVMAKSSPKDQLVFIALTIFYAKADSSWKPDYEFALKWAKLAAAKSDPEDKGVAAMLAQAYYKTGNKKEAVKHQEKYIQMMKKDPAVKPAWVEEAEKTLAQYKS